MEITQVQNQKKSASSFNVGGFSPTPLKNMLLKMGSSSPKVRGESKKSLKPPVMTQV